LPPLHLPPPVKPRKIRVAARPVPRRQLTSSGVSAGGGIPSDVAGISPGDGDGARAWGKQLRQLNSLTHSTIPLPRSMRVVDIWVMPHAHKDTHTHTHLGTPHFVPPPPNIRLHAVGWDPKVCVVVPLPGNLTTIRFYRSGVSSVLNWTRAWEGMGGPRTRQTKPRGRATPPKGADRLDGLRGKLSSAAGTSGRGKNEQTTVGGFVRPRTTEITGGGGDGRGGQWRSSACMHPYFTQGSI